MHYALEDRRREHSPS